MKTIRKGDRGPEVKTCQERLNAHGKSCSADGIFGSGTKACVIEFQRANKLTPDGIVGAATWAALMASPAEPKVLTGAGIPPVIKHAQELGHIAWDEPYRMWLFGIRSNNRDANSFDDQLGCAWVNEDGLWTVEYWPGTTDPGSYWLEKYNPERVSGTAILVEGVDTETGHAGYFKGEVGFQKLLEILALAIIHDVIHQVVHLGMLQGRDVDPADITVNPDHRGKPCRQMQVGGPLFCAERQ